MTAESGVFSTRIRVGEISGLHGVQGWVKVFSDTQPRENIFSYAPWFLGGSVNTAEKNVTVLHWRSQGKTLVAKLEGVESREQARGLLGQAVFIEAEQLPTLKQGEFYWKDLIGLRVASVSETRTVDLGTVERFIETGANDVSVVVGDEKSIDSTERLIPWVPGQYVLNVDMALGQIEVDWDPDF